MTDRIKLTEEHTPYNTELNGKTGVFIETHNIEESSKLIKQILEDYDIVSNLGANPRQLIQEWKEKAQQPDKTVAKLAELKTTFPEVLENAKKWDETERFLEIERYNIMHGIKSQIQGIVLQDESIIYTMKSVIDHIIDKYVLDEEKMLLENKNLKQKLEKIKEWRTDFFNDMPLVAFDEIMNNKLKRILDSQEKE